MFRATYWHNEEQSAPSETFSGGQKLIHNNVVHFISLPIEQMCLKGGGLHVTSVGLSGWIVEQMFQ